MVDIYRVVPVAGPARRIARAPAAPALRAKEWHPDQPLLGLARRLPKIRAASTAPATHGGSHRR